jgi:hypothetical protein
MEQSESIAALAPALVAAQAEFPAIAQPRTAEIPTRGGGKYTYNYADLGDVIAQLQPILARHGLSVLGGPSGYSVEGWTEKDGDAHTVLMVRVDTQLIHESGEWIRTTGAIACRDVDPQSIGSALTYARRQGYAAILGVAPDSGDQTGQRGLPEPTPREDLAKRRRQYFAKAKDAGYTSDQAKELIKRNYDLEHFDDATVDQLIIACNFMDTKTAGGQKEFSDDPR